MSVVAPIQTSFNGGELSPRMRGRVDQAVYGNSMSSMVGFIPLLQGPAEAAPGTIFVANAKVATARLIPFEFSVTQGYQIEAGEEYFRFFTNDAQIMDGAVPYEVATPYTAQQVAELQWEQSFDVLYLFHRDVAPKKLLRTGADTFELQDMELSEGPWEPRNETRSITVGFSGTSGAVTVTSFGSGIFEAGDVGGLLEVETGDFSTIPSWQAGIESTTNDIRQWGGRVYRNAGGTGRTGDLAPTHVEGTEWDGISTGTDINDKGPYGVKWTYLYDRFGLVEFTGFTNANTMSATVLRTLPGTGASWRWRFSAFSTRRGFPEGGCLWQDRLALWKDNAVHCSVTSDYENFAIRNEFGDFSQDMAFSVDLPTANLVRWMMPGDDLLVGTAGGEFRIAERGNGQGVGAGQTRLISPSANGSAPTRPFKVDGRAVYLQRAKKRLLQFPFGGSELYRQESPDLTRYADHIGISAIEEVVYQMEPDRLIWVRRADGTLALAAYMPEEALLGWAQRPLAEGLSATSLSTNTDPDGRYQQVWMIATIDDSTWVLRMEQVRQAGDASADRVMTDASVVYQGAATAALAAPHLANMTVDVVADGRVVMGVELDGDGEATLPFEAESIVYGLPFEATMTTFDHEGGTANGTAQNKRRRVSRVDLLLENADGLEVTCQGVTRKLELGTSSSATDTGFALFSGAKSFELDGSHDRTGPITVRRYLPRPATVLGLIAHQQVGES